MRGAWLDSPPISPTLTMTPGYYLPRQRVSVLYPDSKNILALDPLAVLPLPNNTSAVTATSPHPHPSTTLAPLGTTSTSTSSLSTNAGTITLGTISNIDEDLTKNPIARTLAKERRTCKSFNGEVVWPPKVEAALVQGMFSTTLFAFVRLPAHRWRVEDDG